MVIPLRHLAEQSFKVLKVADISPANMAHNDNIKAHNDNIKAHNDNIKAHNDNIKALQQCWICHDKPACPSGHCFINPNPNTAVKHLVLGHQHFDMWGAAMVGSLL